MIEKTTINSEPLVNASKSNSVISSCTANVNEEYTSNKLTIAKCFKPIREIQQKISS